MPDQNILVLSCLNYNLMLYHIGGTPDDDDNGGGGKKSQNKNRENKHNLNWNSVKHYLDKRWWQDRENT